MELLEQAAQACAQASQANNEYQNRAAAVNNSYNNNNKILLSEQHQEDQLQSYDDQQQRQSSDDEYDNDDVPLPTTMMEKNSFGRPDPRYFKEATMLILHYVIRVWHYFIMSLCYKGTIL
jgi:phage tail sheath gpL-like